MPKTAFGSVNFETVLVPAKCAAAEPGAPVTVVAPRPVGAVLPVTAETAVAAA